MVDVLLDQVSKRYSKAWVVRGVSMRVEGGEAVVLLGPTGSGKTTILRLIAGLETPSGGDILFDGKPAPEALEERNVTMLFADNRLNPRMSARSNIAFPLTVRKTPEPEKTYRVEAEAGALGIEDLLDRMPSSLSAGQSNLVHLAKAMVRAPGVFLIDEPLNAVDAQAKRELRVELRKIQKGYGATAIYATHDQEDAMSLADRLAIIEDGRIVQTDPPEVVYRKPVNLFVATFLGSPEMSILRGKRGAAGVTVDGLTLSAPAKLPDSVLVGVRPERWERKRSGLRASVSGIDDLGSEAYVTLVSAAGDITMRWKGALPDPGETTNVAPTSYHLFDPLTERSLYHS